MNTEIFLEGNQLDVNESISTLLTLAIDDIKDFAERSTSWSKSIVLPGTANNNKLFGHIFDISQSNTYNPELKNIGYNFNAAKSASCIIFQDNIQTFKGVLRLLEIVIDRGAIEYEVQVVGELAGLNVALSGARLEDLDFSAYDHTYNATNIVNSWNNPGGSGYYYPLIDYGGYSSDKHNWDVRTFRPALYVKEILSKMFAAANYRVDCPLFETDRFKKLVVPNNTKVLQQLTDLSIKVSRVSPYLVVGTSGSSDFVTFDTTTELKGFNLASGISLIYEPTETSSIKISFTASGTYTRGGSVTEPFYLDIIRQNTTTPNPETIFTRLLFNAIPGNTNAPWAVSFTTEIELSDDDYFYILLRKREGYTAGTFDVYLNYAVLDAESLSPTYVPVALNSAVEFAKIIPQNVRQISFFKSIVQLFNLYVYEDRLDSRLIHIKPYIDFFTGDAVDWSYKMDRDKPIRIKPLSELNAKVYEFKYKQDGDHYNEMYRKRYGEGYGDRIYDSEFEFTAQKKSLELIFSGTPIVKYLQDDKYYSTILKQSGTTEEQTDSNIRILQTKKITGAASWNIMHQGSSISSQTSYGYAGHFDDPAFPTNDLNFGALKELFSVISGGNLSTTQFNVYWSPYMAEITDKDSKMVTASFYLKPSDIASLDFSKYIYLDGVLFRLNKIIDYNMSSPGPCKVELIKVNHTQY